MSYTAHVDTFARDNLPPREQWPELVFELPELAYPERINCATELLDAAIARGWGGRTAIRAPDGFTWTYEQLLAAANRIANVLVDDLELVPGNRVLLRAPNNPMMAACWLAVVKAGGIAVGTMPLFRAKELTSAPCSFGVGCRPARRFRRGSGCDADPSSSPLIEPERAA